MEFDHSTHLRNVSQRVFIIKLLPKCSTIAIKTAYQTRDLHWSGGSSQGTPGETSFAAISPSIQAWRGEGGFPSWIVRQFGWEVDGILKDGFEIWRCNLCLNTIYFLFLFILSAMGIAADSWVKSAQCARQGLGSENSRRFTWDTCRTQSTATMFVTFDRSKLRSPCLRPSLGSISWLSIRSDKILRCLFVVQRMAPQDFDLFDDLDRVRPQLSFTARGLRKKQAISHR